MSKNIIIQEGGQGKQLTADKLKTNLVGGGTCLWVPEDEVTLGTKTITENGTYKASDDGYYGYSDVTVYGIGTATGRDGDGDEATATTDPETGDIIITKMPSSIKVVTPPRKTDYNDGETIVFDGMAVKAYLASGEEWSDSTHSGGVIPISELSLPVTKASAEKTSGDKATSSIVDGEILLGGFYIEHKTVEQKGLQTITTEGYYSISGGTITSVQTASNTIRSICASQSGGSAVIVNDYTITKETPGQEPEQTNYHYETTYNMGYSYTYNGKTVYYANPIYIFPQDVSWGNTDGPTSPQGPIAWTMIYGEIEHGAQTIPVNWNRPSDLKELSSSFDITVNAEFGGATGGGGEAGDTGAGRND